MKMELCSRCKKRMAVVFVTRFDGEKTVNEGICLRCAKELGIKAGRKHDREDGTLG